MAGAASVAAETSAIPIWGSIPEEWQAQCKKAALAAVVAGGTVMLAPIISPMRQHQPHHKPHAKPHAREGSWAEHTRHQGTHRHGHWAR